MTAEIAHSYAPELAPSTQGAPQRQASGRQAPRKTPRPPQLTLIDGVPHVRHVPIVVLCGLLLLTGMLTVLVLNAALAQDSYEVRDMRKASVVLADAQEALRERIRTEQAPDQLKAFAESQGMRTATVSAYINTANGKIYGTPRAAKDDAAPAPAPKPAPQEGAARTAQPAASSKNSDSSKNSERRPGSSASPSKQRTSASGAAQASASARPAPHTSR